MWARHSELALAAWMGVSPLVLRHGQMSWLWWHDLAMAVVIGGLALLSHRRRFAWCHLLQLVVAAWLLVLGWWHAHGTALDAPPASQNWIVVGLALLLFAIVPNHAFRPPGTRARELGEGMNIPERK